MYSGFALLFLYLVIDDLSIIHCIGNGYIYFFIFILLTIIKYP